MSVNCLAHSVSALICVFFCSSDVTAISHVEIHLKSQECASKRDLLRPWPDSYSEVLLLAICLHWPHAQYKGHLAPLINEDPIQCTIVRSESFQSMATYQKKTRGEKTCRITHRANFVFHDGVKINTLAFHQMQKAGIYLVSSNFGFIMQYLKMNLFRFLRGTLARGQETSVREMLLQEGDCSIHSQCFRNYL